MRRLVGRLKTRPRGVDLLGSLVQSLRYCGLLEESLAADTEAKAIDPSARTSVAYTLFVAGDYETAATTGTESDVFLHALAYLALGRRERAQEVVRALMDRVPNSMLSRFLKPTELLAAGDFQGAIEVGRSLYRDFPDPEGRFLFARELAWTGCADEALDYLGELVPQYSALPSPGRDPWLASIDTTERYSKLLARAEADREAYRKQYLALRVP